MAGHRPIIVKVRHNLIAGAGFGMGNRGVVAASSHFPRPKEIHCYKV
jgi:hypothetical protein